MASATIRSVEVFFEPGPTMAALIAGGSTAGFLQGSSAVVQGALAEADQTFNLGGALVHFGRFNPPSVTTVQAMDDSGWKRLLDGRGRGTEWQRWFASTRDGRWSVVVWAGGSSSSTRTTAPPQSQQPWERFADRVRIAWGMPENHRLVEIRLHFIFRSQRDATNSIYKLPLAYQRALQDASNMDGVNPNSGMFEVIRERVKLSIAETKDLMNQMVASGGEIHRAVLTM